MKIGIIGIGMVGSTAAYALIMRGVGSELVLVDANQKRAQAEADDLLHGVPFAHPLQVRAGDYPDLVDCQVVIITAGVSQRPGETRLQLLDRNAQVFKQVVPQVLKYAPQAVLLVTTNPVDVMTHLTARIAKQIGIPSSQIIGSGTTLDTARFRALLGRQLGVDSQHVHAYVIGEHGDSEVLAWSSVSVGGIPLDEYCRQRGASVCEEDHHTIDKQVRQAAYKIIAGKGATYFGIGSALAKIVEVIWRDQRAILTVCTPQNEVAGIRNVTASLPNMLGQTGIIATLHPILDPDEWAALGRSAAIIRKALEGLEQETDL